MMDVSILSGTLSGTPYLASYLKSRGIETELLSIDHVSYGSSQHDAVKVINDILVNYIKKTSPRLVGVSTFYLERVVSEIKQIGIPLVLGGPEALQTLTYLHEYEPEKMFYDYGIDGLPLDLPKLLDLVDGKNVFPKEIRGLVYVEDGKLKHNPPVWTKDYYLQNKPDLEFKYPHRAFLEASERGRFNQIWVPDTLGCPHAACSYCSIGKPFLSFTPKEIVQLIKDVLDQNPGLPIGLSTQTIHKIGSICKELKKQDVTPEYLAVMSRADGFVKNYPKLVDALETGIKIDIDCVGFESFLQEDLDILNKGTTVEQNLQCVTWLRELAERYPNFYYKNPNGHGLIPFLPWSTPKTIHKQFDILKKHEMWDIFNVYVLGNYLKVSWNEKSKEKLLECANSTKKPNVRIVEMGSFDNVVGALVWMYNSEAMLKLTEFYNRLYNKIVGDRMIPAPDKFSKASNHSTDDIVQESMAASKYMIENMCEISGVMLGS